MASRDSLHEQDMWVVEGLTHRYPTKVLAELLSTCPQYCGHCTRMDLVGNSTPQVAKNKLQLKPTDRADRILEHLRASPGIRDVVVSGGDLANMPWPRLERFIDGLLGIESIRDIRLASKGLVGCPHHLGAPAQRAGGVARVRGADACLARGCAWAGCKPHCTLLRPQQITPAVAEASGALLGAGLHDVRNQGVLMRGVNDSAHDLLDLCFALIDHAAVTAAEL
ncbi:hypothetical protein [Streptomyces sp. DHE17-7]|uniref:hypothetical protein n=1 Tax=Streptomyces sp. DHE17-7 TaxID=2759949 RepID=UPI0022EA8B40|nr:hypothetical protein [Streptomyces sp. DHE17-7]